MYKDNNKMNALKLRQHGADFDLEMTQLDLPIPKGNELLIKVEYVALNHLDASFAVKGFSQWQYPHILGSDAVGTVVDAPKGVFPAKGARVLFHANLAQQGMLKQFTVMPNHAVSELPEQIESELAVALPNSGMAALLALEKIKLQEGDTLAINSAQGAVAHFAIQYAKKQGAQVFAFAQKPHHKRLKKLGADFVFDCSKKDDAICAQIKHEIGPDGFDCVINTIGKESVVQDIQKLRFCGRIACLNGFSAIPEELLFEKAPNIGVVSIAGAWLANSLCAQQHLCFMGETLLKDIESGAIQAPEIELIEFNSEKVKETLQCLLNQTCIKRPVVKIT